MRYKSIFFFVIFLIYEFGDAHYTKGQNQVIASRQLGIVGSYEDKTYFSEDTQMTWDESSAHCIRNNMTLIRVESLPELFYIWSVLNFNDSRFYWTEGREYGSYQWNDGTVVPLGIASGSDSFNNCVMIYNSSGRLLRYPCNGNPESRKTLPVCQTIK